MGLAIETFDAARGGSAFFKAIGHPLVAPRVQKLLGELAHRGSLAVFDPDGRARELFALFPERAGRVCEHYVLRAEDLGRASLGIPPRPPSELSSSRAEVLLIASFDAARLRDRVVAPLAPPGLRIHTLDEVRLPDSMLTRPERLLDPLNFATNLALFRDDASHRTQLVTANYWCDYGATAPWLWLCLFDADGAPLAQWREDLPAGPALIRIDSRELRQRFGTGPFCGSLFLHAIGIAGHDVLKYALDDFDPSAPGCEAPTATHDANAWPADLYAGLPAPRAGERVALWIQNPHPVAIPAGAIGVRPLGGRASAANADADGYARCGEETPPFGTRAVDVGELLPGLHWPAQVEVRAGRHIARPRYEIATASGRRIAHANVERSDLVADPELARLAPLLGKGYLLPAPILPCADYRSSVLPTPMATRQTSLALELRAYTADGSELARERLGGMRRGRERAIEISAWLSERGGALGRSHGHLELLYDLAADAPTDGWLHALFRYEHRASGRSAETSFGSHLFNLPLTYRDEPQSYAGNPPGLSTRLFLRIGAAPFETVCVLIYPASGRWHAQSSTQVVLRNGAGFDVARRELAIPLSGSVLFRVSELFSGQELARAGSGASALVRDETCRLFGYHGLFAPGGAFSFDHLFGF
jgi:hypothetical protein